MEQQQYQYQFQYNLDDFKDLRHIQWVADHIEEYEFHGNTGEIKLELMQKIQSKNVFYSDCIAAYKKFCDAFDNNPYNYMTGVLGNDENYISSPYSDHYFMIWGIKQEWVPIAFLVGTDRETSRSQLKSWLNGTRKSCAEVFKKIRTYGEEARSEIAAYSDNMILTESLCRKQGIHDFLALFLTWVLLLFSISVDPGYQNFFEGLGNRPFMELIAALYLEPDNFLIAAVEFTYLILFICMIRLSFQYKNKQTYLVFMSEVKNYAIYLEQLRDIAAQAEGILYQPLPLQMMRNDCSYPMADLLNMSQRKFHYKKGKPEPENYPFYGRNLWKSVIWIMVINFVLLTAEILLYQ